MRYTSAFIGVVIPLLGAFLGTVGPVRAATIVVASDGKGTVADCSAPQPALSKIQTAIDVSQPGDVILVCPGVYDEQVVVPSNRSSLTLRGAGASSTVIRPSAVALNTTTTVLGTPAAAILLVNGAVGVTISGLTVDGGLADTGAVDADCRVTPFFIGVFLRGGSASASQIRVTNIRSSTRCADGLRAESGAFSITRSQFDNYGRSGINCAGSATTCQITNNGVRGLGPVEDQGQYGIGVRTQAGAKVADNLVTDHFRVGANGVPAASVGIVLFNAQPETEAKIARDNVFSGNQVNVQRQGSAASF